MSQRPDAVRIDARPGEGPPPMLLPCAACGRVRGDWQAARVFDTAERPDSEPRQAAAVWLGICEPCWRAGWRFPDGQAREPRTRARPEAPEPGAHVYRPLFELRSERCRTCGQPSADPRHVHPLPTKEAP